MQRAVLLTGYSPFIVPNRDNLPVSSG